MTKEDDLECQTDLECLSTMLEQTREQIFGKWLDGELCGRMEAEDLGFSDRMKSHKANLESVELELTHVQERMNLCEKVAEDKSKEIKNLKRKIEEVQSETDKLLLERERLAKVLKESEQDNKRTKESIDSQSTATEEVKKELEKAAGYFSERMGMKINKVSGERVQIIFTSIDDKDPQQPFCFCVKITKERSYTVTDCEPLVKDLDELSQKLNKTNDFRSFVITMRRRFKAMV